MTSGTVESLCHTTRTTTTCTILANQSFPARPPPLPAPEAYCRTTPAEQCRIRSLTIPHTPSLQLFRPPASPTCIHSPARAPIPTAPSQVITGTLVTEHKISTQAARQYSYTTTEAYASPLVPTD